MVRKIDAAGRAIDHDPHRAFGGMRAHIDHGTFEAGIAHHGHGDQELAVEIAGVGRIVARAGLPAANLARFFAFRVHPRSTLESSHILILGGFCVNQACGLAVTSNSMVRPGSRL